jgi:hypothetical protein
MVNFRKVPLGPHQWLVRPLSGIFVSTEGEVNRYVLVGYSNPKTTGLPNHLIFAVPLHVYRADPEADTDLHVCFDPETAIPLLQGLYWKDGDLRYDPEKDRLRFWKPVEKSLWETTTAEGSKCQDGHKERRTEQDWQTLEGVAYIDSLTACLKRWSEEKQVLQNAIQT